MEGLNNVDDDVFQHYRLNPTDVEAVTYYLPRLLAGETLHCAEKLIHRADVYDCEPKDLAALYAPVPQAVSSGDRFFFTPCKRKKGRTTRCARTAGGGTWTVNTTTVIRHAGVEVGERKNLSFKRKGKSTGWVMEEYRLLPPKAVVADEEKVFCKIHLSQHPPDEARRESAAYKLQQRPEPAPQPAPQPEHVGKRPAPAAAADPHPPRPMKRMRAAVPAQATATPSFAAAAPVSLPLQPEPIPEADDDMFSCSMEELLGDVQVEETLPVEARNDIQQNFYSEPEEMEKLFADAEEEIMGTFNAEADLHAPVEAGCQAEEELDIQTLWALYKTITIMDEATAEQERPAVSTNDKSSMVQDNSPPISFHPSEAEWHADEALEKDNAASDLQAPSLQGHDDHLFNSRPSCFDPFEAAWRAEEALENENAAANLQARPLRGHDDFFSSSTVY
ncbi:Dehydration-responsive element-binding protein 2B [Hordeum vulgare]|uniref:NAC domain-containing protein n=1 Tax=Hordeum vulgare subsp. vulgare TaxID=112509 RepID=A0A8I6YTT7_HORVV|nr:uncharacterized protein LOC123413071 [Hordeum vulgare subsp. vulgare]KAE8784749.1 Dehydration-responsive element-binding protein 2B [Hordeum vulgare]KAI4963371.1 hypothetical protein ZWY2020_014954 [Hordeum vulgare]KAI4975812.1 hypothetical protein ZWY2020_049419 [Hordeum vulgare]